MILDMLSNLYRNNPYLVINSLAGFCSIVALRPQPTFLTLLGLLTILRFATRVIVPRPHAKQRLSLLWAVVSLGCMTSFTNTASSALSNPLPAFVYTGAFSFLALVPFYLAAMVGHLHNIFAFPAIWTTYCLLLTSTSPVGRLGVWSPLTGGEAFTWLRPYVGEAGIDWVLASGVEIVTEILVIKLMGSGSPAEEEHLISIPEEEDAEGETEPSNPAKNRKPRNLAQLALLSSILAIISIPSAFITALPPPIHRPGSNVLGVGCVLPDPSSTKTPFENYMKETMTLANQASIILWPEGAVTFDSEADRDEKFGVVQGNAGINGVWIAVSFIEPIPGEKDRKLRNGLALINRRGVHSTYYKRHLVPLVEGFPQKAGTEPPEVVNLKIGPGSRPKEQWDLPISFSICLDFAHPFPILSQRPTLVLGPARTWHITVGSVMKSMAEQRADELGTTVLWCDGGVDGLSGLVGNGESVVQVGWGSWVRKIGVDTALVGSRTLYGTVGSFPFIVTVWLLFGVGVILALGNTGIALATTAA